MEHADGRLLPDVLDVEQTCRPGHTCRYGERLCCTSSSLMVRLVCVGNPNDLWKGFDDAPPASASVALDERERLRLQAIKRATLYRGQVLN